MAIFIPLVTKFDDKGVRSARDALKRFGSFAADVSKVAASAVAAVGVASVREAAQFESSIAKVEGLVGVAGAELQQMAEAARRLGIETGKGAQEASDALFVIASSGLRGADAIDALELSLKASTAGLGETESIARSVSGALNAYGVDVISAAEATDVIVATARAGNFETSQFASAIGRVLPFAKQAGSSLEDMGGAVALLTRTNTDAAQSVTQVSALFRAFVVPTEQAKTALDNVGLSAQDMRDAIASEGLPAALDMLDEKLGGNREQLGRLLGSSEAASAAFQILNADSQTIAETFGVVNDATGITQEAFEVMQDTVENKFAVAMATAKDSLLEIGGAILEKLSPRLDDFSEWMEKNGPDIEQGFIKIFDAADEIITSDVVGKIVTTFADLWPEIQDTVTQVGELAAALTPLLEGALGKVLPMIGDLAGILSDVTFFLNEAVGLIGDFEGDTPGFVQAIENIINPFDRAAGAIKTVRDLLNDVRLAFEKFMRSGGIESLDTSKIATSIGGAGGQGLEESIGTGTFTRGRTPAPIPTRPAPELPRISYFGSGDLYGRRAGGGLVAGGASYLVGEMGPEIFTPAAGGGSITPNNQIGGATYNITVNAGMGSGNGSQIGEAIVTAIKRYERTSGPVFAKA